MLKTIGTAVTIAMLALGVAGTAHAAPAAVPNATGNDLTLAVTHNSDGSLTATLGEAWNVGDCQQLPGGTVTLHPIDANSASVEWTAFLLTRKTSNRDIWFEDATYRTASGGQVAKTIGRFQGPDMKVGPIYPEDGFRSATLSTASLSLATSVDLHADC